MRTHAAVIVALLAAACAGPEVAVPRAPGPTPVPVPATAAAPGPVVHALRNPGFESPFPAGSRCAPGWNCSMHNNADAYRFFPLDVAAGAAAGERSLCVERLVKEDWALVTQAVQDRSLNGKRVRMSMMVRLDGVAGAGAGPWILVQGTPPRNVTRLAAGTTGWRPVVVELDIPRQAQVVEFGAILEGGGRACFDDVVVEVLPGT